MDAPFHLNSVRYALVVGAGHGIGLEVVKHLIQNSKAHVFALFSDKSRAGDLFHLKEKYPERVTYHQVGWKDEAALEKFFAHLNEQKIKFDFVVNTVGVLHSGNLEPEKSLRQVNFQSLTESFQVNAFLTPLLAKFLRPCFERKRTFLFAALSAMVGSIEDNSSGGWYSYRASKTALNMFIKNISLEFKRSFPSSVVLAIHPGTTHTQLSRPFSGNVKHQVWEPGDTATHLFNVFEAKSVEHTGRFYNWDGTQIPW